MNRRAWLKPYETLSALQYSPKKPPGSNRNRPEASRKPPALVERASSRVKGLGRWACVWAGGVQSPEPSQR